ncbi:inositol monophosphatase [Nakamurella sp. A5-74]|uniref:Inositol monophosphatase n=1 Tax=Nakamurella sp. A5-74 TaxID=3158264 RepID=A0AAU8DP66_9ACTN
MTPPPDEQTALALELACDAARQIATHRAQTITTKAHAADLVTELDTSIEQTVRAAVAARFPEHRFVGEEFGATGADDASISWYCDPVDGTTNFAHDLGWSSFSLCARDSTGPAWGVIAHPTRREVLVGQRGGGAWRIALDEHFRPTQEWEPLRASSTTSLAGTVFTTELLSHRPWPGTSAMIGLLADRSCTARIMGSSALTLAQVGAGRAAGAIIGRFSPIDNQAAILIGLEAGARCLDESGQDTTWPAGGGVLLAAPGVADELSELWRQAREAASET